MGIELVNSVKGFTLCTAFPVPKWTKKALWGSATPSYPEVAKKFLFPISTFETTVLSSESFLSQPSKN